MPVTDVRPGRHVERAPDVVTRTSRFATVWAAAVTVVLGLVFAGTTALTLALWASDPAYSQTSPVVDLAFFAFGGILVTVGFASQIRARKIAARQVAGLQQALVALFALAVAGLLAGRIEPFVGALLLLVAAAPLVVLHPARRQLLAAGETVSRPLAALGIAAVMPAVAYAAAMLDRARSAGPSCFLGRCAAGDRFAETAALAVAVVLVALLASLRTSGWRVSAWCGGSAAIVLGAASLAFPQEPGALGAPWGWLPWSGAPPASSPGPHRALGERRGRTFGQQPARQVRKMATHTLAPGETRRSAAAARWLAAGVAVLVAGASTAGLWAPGLYTDPAAVAAMFRGYDLVTLVVVAPLLALTVLPIWRGRPAAQLLRISMLAYCVYNYAYYLFGAQLNALLLAHIAIFAASLDALVLSLTALDVSGLSGRFRPRTPVRTVAVILLVLGVPLAAIQVSGLARFALTGAIPQEPSQLAVPLGFTRLGAVLDLSLLVPAYLLAAVWLWRRRAWGYLLATVVLVAGFMHQVSYIAGMVFQLAAAIPGAAFDPFEPFIVALFATGGGLLLANLRPATPETSSAPQDRTPATARR